MDIKTFVKLMETLEMMPLALSPSKKEKTSRLTSGVDLSLLNGSRVEESSRLQQLEVALAVVGDDGLDLGVALHLQAHVQRGRGTLLHQGSGGSHRGEGETSKKLHF